MPDDKDDMNILGLSTIRKNRGVSLQQIAEATKISVRSLQAIECGDFRKLPGGIYNTSYIRQYARAIDYDETVILKLYYREMGSEPLRTENEKSTIPNLRPASSILGL
jgi:cytoskeletal protein RodZ